MSVLGNDTQNLLKRKFQNNCVHRLGKRKKTGSAACLNTVGFESPEVDPGVASGAQVWKAQQVLAEEGPCPGDRGGYPTQM